MKRVLVHSSEPIIIGFTLEKGYDVFQSKGSVWLGTPEKPHKAGGAPGVSDQFMPKDGGVALIVENESPVGASFPGIASPSHIPTLPPMRHVLLALFALISLATAEHVIVTGGPALRDYENLRVPQDQHDRFWGNFVRASTLRMAEIRTAYGKDASIVWMVYRAGYQERGKEDRQPYTTWIGDLARKRNVSLIWVDSGPELISALNNRPRGSVSTFDYFGHSNRHCFMLDYGNHIMAACTAWLHERDLGKIRGGIFAKDAYCKSWGCHTGESMAKVWKSATGVKMEAARGKTDYTVISKGLLPVGEGWVR